MLLDVIRILILILVALAYALFDVFNKRNVPNAFAYFTIGLGILITLTYGIGTIELSAAYAVIISAIGYLTYRAGILGAGDLFEFVFISLVLPTQLTPILADIPQFSFPFILSVFIATGYATLLSTPLYYINKARKKLGKIKTSRKDLARGLALLAAYAVLILILNISVSNMLLGSALLLLAAIPSSIIIAYKQAIYEGMTLYVYPSKLENDDMIATSMMSRSDLAFFKRKSKHFGGLASKKLISEIRNVKRKIPVYKNAIPLALFTFAGVLISLLVGNIIVLMLL